MRATFRIILFPRPNKAGLYPIKLRASFLRTTKDYTLHRYCTLEQWDASASRFRKSFPAWAKENDILRTYEQRASDALRDFEREGVRFTFEAFEQRVFADRAKTGHVAWRWMLEVSGQMREGGQFGNSVFYRNVSAVVKNRPLPWRLSPVPGLCRLRSLHGRAKVFAASQNNETGEQGFARRGGAGRAERGRADFIRGQALLRDGAKNERGEPGYYQRSLGAFRRTDNRPLPERF